VIRYFLVNSVVIISLMGGLSSASAADNSALIRRMHEGAQKSGSDRLVITENGHTLLDDHFGQTDVRGPLQSVMSITKSVCALAIGILQDRGAIKSVDQPASTWIPEWKQDPVRSKITLKMLMTHTSGLPDDEAIGDASNRIDYATKIPLVAAPGEKFIYSGVGSALLQTVIAQASGQTLTAFIDEALFAPLGITDREWLTDATGHEKTGGGLSLRSSDLLKIGELMLGQGMYHGQRIVSAQRVSEMTTKSQSLEDYGLMWWLKNPNSPATSLIKPSQKFKVFHAAGWGGQFIIVYPEKKLIVIRSRDPKTIDEKKMDEQEFGQLPWLATEWQ
jgi:CubicO group peptidase (beta-lactamase class C family)